jgi:polyisoprenyl-teichoic acid--peptidoglycan teichoic acid transferase
MDKDHSTADLSRRKPDATKPASSTDSDLPDMPDFVRSERSDSKARVKYSRVKRKILKHVWPVRVFLMFLLFAVVGTLGFGAYVISKNLGLSNFFNLAGNFITANESLIASDNGRVNILVMGIGGEGHAGSLLTDTMLLVSIGLEDPSVVSVSIPRDIWIPELRIKINSAYYWGDQKNPGKGSALARSVVKDVLGVQIHYSALVDFSGFRKIIDVVGGVDVEVETAFTDDMYPIAGLENDLCGGDKTYKCRYESIAFDEGVQTMDGEIALKFVRSRHAEGDEGTDFARSRRQQKVIEAIKNKLVTPQIFLNPRKIFEIREVFMESIQTDIEMDQAAVIARKIFDSKDNIKSYSIPEDLLVNPPISKTYDNLYVFIPKAGNGNWEEIHKWMVSVIQKGPSSL